MQAKHLLTSFHCYAVDLRGMGDSQMDVPETLIEDGDYAGSHEECLHPSTSLPTLEGFAADISAVVGQLSWKGRVSTSFTFPYFRISLHTQGVNVLTA